MRALDHNRPWVTFAAVVVAAMLAFPPVLFAGVPGGVRPRARSQQPPRARVGQPRAKPPAARRAGPRVRRRKPAAPKGARRKPRVPRKPVKPPRRAVFPRWFPPRRPILPALPAVLHRVERITVAGRTLVVPDPKELVVEVPAPSVVVTPSPQATEGQVGAAQQAGQQSPLVQFALLADQRLRELRAYSEAGQRSDKGIEKGEDGKYYKAYYRFPLRSIGLSVKDAAALELEGEIAYDRVLFVQSAESKEALLEQTGRPYEQARAVRVTEKYRFKNGKWEYVEKR